MEIDVSQSVLKLLEQKELTYPTTPAELNEFIANNLGKIWDAFLSININSNLGVYSNLDKAEKFAKVGFVSYDEDNSFTAWAGLERLLLLIISLEDFLGIEITPFSNYEKANDFSIMKFRIRNFLNN
jgi:hypothetical protein